VSRVPPLLGHAMQLWIAADPPFLQHRAQINFDYIRARPLLSKHLSKAIS